MRRGRPLRFVAVVVAAWTVGRVALLLPDAPVPPGAVQRIPTADRSPRADSLIPYALARDLLAPPPFARSAGAAPSGSSLVAMTSRGITRPAPGWSDRQILAAVGIPFFVVERPPEEQPESAGIADLWFADPPPPGVPGAAAPVSALRRWRLDGWLLVRESGSGGGSALTPQLGGGQAGARLTYTLDRAARVAGFARAAAPLRGAGAELAAGVQWQPVARLPVTAYAELRQRERGGPAPTVGAFGGVYQAPLAFDLRLDGYAQGGWAGGRGATAFVDGQLRISRPVATAGPVTLDAAAGAWGAAQRGAARLDAGPSVGAALPLAGGRVRAQVDWRWRLAGRARPASGPALTIAAGF